jgi:hypothetical protein
VLSAFVVGGALTATLILVGEREKNAALADPAAAASTLSDSTREALAALKQPVELHYYALFDGSPSDTQKQLETDAGALLELFAEIGGRNVQLSRATEWTDDATRQASADGIRPQGLTEGHPFYLGVVVKQSERSEAVPQITGAWLAALEFDLARAIARVANPPVAPKPAEEAGQAEAAVASVNRLFPDPAAVSFEAGRQQLREASLKEFEAGVAKMQKDVTAVEARLRAAEAESSEPDRLQALADLQQLKARHETELRNIARRAQAEQEAWAALKGR